MVIEQFEKAKADYTDKYVALAGDRPVYARFAGLVGQVKTVNISGRALVEWLGHDEDIGWNDVDLNHLKVVSKSVPVAADTPKAKAKPAVTKKNAGGLSPLELLRQQGSGKKKNE